MELREWILKPYLDELGNLEERFDKIDAKLASIEARVMDLYSKLDNKADKDRLRNIERELEHVENITDYLFNALKDLRNYAIAQNEGSGSEQSGTLKSDEELVLELIRQGNNSPRNIARKLKIGVGRLYEILERLEAENKVRRIKKGRREKLILIED